MNDYTCDFCDRTDEKGCNKVNDEYACDDCYQNMVDRAEWAYESAKEEGLV